jgi:Phage integrase, N-terminal SAM-like domain
VRRYQLYLLNEKKLAPGTVEIRMSALRFFYRKTLKRRDLTFDDLPFPKKPTKLPTSAPGLERYFDYKVEGDFSDINGTLVRDLYARIHRTDAFQLSFGQFRVPISQKRCDSMQFRTVSNPRWSTRSCPAEAPA